MQVAATFQVARICNRQGQDLLALLEGIGLLRRKYDRREPRDAAIRLAGVGHLQATVSWREEETLESNAP